MQLINESVTAMPLPIPMSAVVLLQRKRAKFDKILDAIAALGEAAALLGCQSPKPLPLRFILPSTTKILSSIVAVCVDETKIQRETLLCKPTRGVMRR